DGVQRQQTDLVNSKTIVPAKITEITGITQLMVDQAAIAAEVFPDYLPLLNTGVLTVLFRGLKRQNSAPSSFPG
ncbi:MAG: hypothetical protein MUF49_31765, partial [Oculatellaceae cyanobacterium Prado106]|nr:hypothetical protein [Oculatellaceae cyanobacterium Prado106]